MEIKFVSGLTLLLAAFLLVNIEAVSQGEKWTSGMAVVDRFGKLLRHKNLKCWLNDQALESNKNGLPVTSWADNSGAIYGNCQFDATLNVVTARNRLNNRHTAFFSDVPSSSYLRNSNSQFTSALLQGPTASGSGISPFTAFFVVKLAPFTTNRLSTPGTYPTIFSLRDSVAAAGSDLRLEVRQADGGPGWITYRLWWGTGAQFVETRAPYVQDEMHIVVLVQEKDRSYLYVDGTSFAEGVINRATPDLTPTTIPVINQNTVTAYLGHGYDPENFNGQIAEVIVYDATLSVFEIDRIGTYLGYKFDRRWNALRSSAAWNSLVTPVTIQPSEGPVSGTRITIMGSRLLPYDTNCDGVGNFGDVLTSGDLTRLQNSLTVTVGIPIPVCQVGQDSGTSGCAPGSSFQARVERECTSLQLLPTSDAFGDGTGDSGSAGTIVCSVPPGISTGRSVEILIKWQGIELSVPSFRYRSPVVSLITPNQISIAGGETISLYGDNFSPGDYWVSQSMENAVAVEFISAAGTITPCKTTTFISSGELRCVTPALVAEKATGITQSQRSLTVQIRIRAGTRVFRQTNAAATVSYANLPYYYACDRPLDGTDARQIGSCLTCCSSNCQSDTVVPTSFGQCEDKCRAYCVVSTPQSCSSDVAATCTTNLASTTTVQSLVPGVSVFTSAQRIPTATSYSPQVATLGSAVTFTISGSGFQPTDKVKIISYYGNCGGVDDQADAITGGSGQVFATVTNSNLTATVTFTPAVFAVGKLCYLFTGSGSYVEIGGASNAAPLTILQGKPSLLNIIPLSKQTTGGSSITVLGSEFGYVVSSGRVRTGDSNCEGSTWISSSCLLAKTPSTISPFLTVALTVARNVGTLQGVYRNNALQISSAVRTNLPKTGSLSLTVLGSCMGATNVSPRARVTAPNLSALATVWVSDSALVFKTPTGASKLVRIVASAGRGLRFTSINLVSYNAPSNTLGFQQSNSPATGSVSLTVLGSGMGGLVSNSEGLRIQVTASPATTFASSSSLRGKSCNGQIGLQTIRATVGSPGNIETVTNAFSFNLNGGSVSQLIRANGPATGSISITTVGVAFGLGASHSARFYTGGTAAEHSNWISDSSVVPKQSALDGIGRSYYLSVDAKSVGATVTLAFSADKPVPSSALRTNTPITGAVSVTVLGFRLGGSKTGRSQKHRVQSTGAQASAWASDSSVMSKVAQSFGGPKSQTDIITVTRWAGPDSAQVRQHSSFTMAVSYDSNGLRNLGNNNLPVTGSSSLTLVGFTVLTAVTTSAEVGNTASQSTAWISTSATFSRVPASLSEARSGLSAIISVAAQVPVTLTMSLTYSAGAVMSLKHNDKTIAARDLANRPTTGASYVSIVGSSFNRVASSEDVRTGATSAEQGIWTSDSSVTLRLPSGASKGLCVAVSVGSDSRVQSLSSAFSFNRPSLQEMVFAPQPATGSSKVTLFGANLGNAPVYSRQTRVSGGGTASPQSVWFSDSAIVPKLPAAGSERRNSLSVIVTVLGKEQVATSKNSLSYFGAIVTAISKQANSPTTGSISLTVVGSNFGLATRITSVIKIGVISSKATNWFSDTSTLALAPTQEGRALPLTLTVFSVSNVNSAFFRAISRVFTYNHAETSSICTTNAATTGGLSITIVGTQQSSRESTPGVRIQKSAALSTKWQSDSSSAAKIPAMASGLQRMNSVAVSVVEESIFGHRGTLTNSFTWNGPMPRPPCRLECFVGGCGTRCQAINTAATGGQLVTVFGSQFGTTDVTVKSRIGATPTEFTKWNSDSTLGGRVSGSGTKSFIPVVATVTGFVERGTSTNHFSFNVPAPSSINPAFGVGTGAFSVTVTGQNNGRPSPRARFSVTTAEATAFVSDSSLVAKVCAGQGKDLRIVTSLMPNRFNTKIGIWSPSSALSGATRTNLAATGSNSITVLGSGNGIGARSQRIRIGFTAAVSSVWNSDTVIGAKPSASAGASLTVQATTGGVLSTPAPAAVSTDQPAGLDGANSQFNFPATGGSSVTVISSGANVNNAALSSTARIGGSATQASVWGSSSCVYTKVQTGVNRSPRCAPDLVSTVVRQVSSGTLSRADSFDSPAAIGLSIPNSPSSGSISVTIFSNGFAPQHTSPNAMARPGHVGCLAGSWLSSTALVCKTPGEVKSGRQIVLSVLYVRTLSAAFTFNTPNPSAIGWYGFQVPRIATGSANFVLLGNGLGQNGNYNSPRARVAGTAAEYTVWRADTAIVIRYPAGAVSFGSIAATVGTPVQQGTLSRTLTHDFVVISSVTTANIPGTGAISLTLLGSGMSRSNVPIRGRISRTAAMASTWGSDSNLLLKAPLAAPRQPTSSVQISQNIIRLITVTGLFTFNSPAQSVVFQASTRTNIPATGSSSMTVMGASFGQIRTSQASRIGQSAFPVTSWVSDSSLGVKQSQGGGNTRRFQMTILQKTGTSAGITTYDGITSSSCARSNFPVTGSASLTLFGANFGAMNQSPRVKIGRTQLSITFWISDSSLKAKTALAVSGNTRLSAAITILQNYGTSTYVASYDQGSVWVSTPTNMPVTGAARITHSGRNFGSAVLSLSSRVSGTTSESSEWTSDSSFRARIAAGVTANNFVTLTCDTQRNTAAAFISMNRPRLSDAIRTNGPTTGSFSITVLSSGNANGRYSTRARIQTSCQGSVWVSDSSVVGKAAAGGTATMEITTTVGRQAAIPFQNRLSFDGPVVSSLVMVSTPNTGSVSITLVSSSNYGTFKNSQRVRSDGTNAMATDWSATTSVTAKPARFTYSGSGSVKLAVTAHARTATLTSALAYYP